MTIRVTFSGRAYHELRLPDRLELPAGSTSADAIAAIETLLPASCLIALSGRHLGTLAKHEPAPLRDGDELLLLAPVAGG